MAFQSPKITLHTLGILVTISGMSAVGCIHPNIPSVRGDLPAAGGAHTFAPHPGPPAVYAAEGFVAGSSCGPRLPGGPVECPEDDPAVVRSGVLADYLYDTGKPKEPDVPWPRFHPLPTRPVLTGS